VKFRRRNIVLALMLLPVAAAALLDWLGRWQTTQAARERYPGCDTGEQFQLRDGRRLGYRTVGDPSGSPAFYFHAALGSRLEWPVSTDAVRAAGLYLIAVDRPGYGCSDPQPERTLHSWVEDIEQFTSFLRWRTFRIIGWSAGGPHALAVAAWMPGRVEAIDLVGCPAPPEVRVAGQPIGMRVAAGTAAWAPGIAWHLASMYRKVVLEQPEKAEADMLEGVSPAEKQELQRPDTARQLRATHTEALRHSAIGTLEDLRAIAKPWGFALQAVAARVRVWHGTDDSLAPFANAKELAGSLPDATLIDMQNEGHFLLFRNEAAILRGHPAD
jgi:pimeloyl-ACP methyl ester carboxylesterase